MTQQVSAPPLPGAVGVTHLRVYDTQAPDRLVGGSPHLHFACTEAYIVVAGRGAVQTLGAGGFAELPLEPGRLLWFTPGLIHRLINLDGQLEILVLMQNAGLPEAGETSGPTSTRPRWRPAAMSTPAARRRHGAGATWRSRALPCCAEASSSAAPQRWRSSTTRL
jgi:mannose-6-phosphate isomerase-like protein (cupin superfamily)